MNAAIQHLSPDTNKREFGQKSWTNLWYCQEQIKLDLLAVKVRGAFYLCTCGVFLVGMVVGFLPFAIHRQFVRPAVAVRPRPAKQLEPLHD